MAQIDLPSEHRALIAGHMRQLGFTQSAVAKQLGITQGKLSEKLAGKVPFEETEIGALEADVGSYFGYVRAVGRRRPDAPLYDPAVSVPMQYTKQPLLRGQA